MRHWLNVRGPLALAVGALTLIAGCGGGDDQAGAYTAPPAPSPPPFTAPSAPTAPVDPSETTASDGAPCAGFDGVAAEACENAYDLCQVSGEQAIADEYAGGDVETAAERYAEASAVPGLQIVAETGCLEGFEDAR